MNISTGYLKSRLIKMPKDIRPTQNKIRKAIFDILQDIQGFVCLELFAGSGAIGIEAVSNGATEVVFVDDDGRHCKLIEDNIRSLGLDSDPNSKLSILSMDAFFAVKSLYEKKRKFDIIFLDPPYYMEIAKKILKKLTLCDILAPHGLIVVEHNRKDFLDEKIDHLICFKQKAYGDTLLSFYRKEIA